MRNILLKIHLYLGLFAAFFLVILGVTGGIIAFEEDAELWLNPQIHYVPSVPAGAKQLSTGEQIEKVKRAVAPLEVLCAQVFQEPNRNTIILVTPRKPKDTQMEYGNWRYFVNKGGGRVALFVNPYDGTIVGRYDAVPQNQKILGTIHQFHMRIGPDPKSWGAFNKFTRQLVDYSGLALCFMVPTGVILWWRSKRARFKWSSTSFQFHFDLHSTIGIYAAAFLFVAAVTGVVVSFESVQSGISYVTGSTHTWHSGGPDSTPVDGAEPISIDKAIEIGRQQIPEATFDAIGLPRTPKQSYSVLMRVPEEVTPAVHSSVTVDQYSGKPLQVLNFKKDDVSYRIIRLSRALHTGDIYGMPSRIVVAISSLLTVVMAITGVFIWWKRRPGKVVS